MYGCTAIVNKIEDLTELTYSETKYFVMLCKEMLGHVQRCDKENYRVHAGKLSVKTIYVAPVELTF